MLHINNNIRLIRELSGQTQAEFGKMFGANETKVKSYERGKAKPKSIFMLRLAKYAGITTSDLIDKKLSEDDIKIPGVQKVENVSRGTLQEPQPAYNIEASLVRSHEALTRTHETQVEICRDLVNILKGLNLSVVGSASLPVLDLDKGKSRGSPTADASLGGSKKVRLVKGKKAGQKDKVFEKGR